ncbi:MAG: LpqB family beta-propeller domain-containing protein, partial [Vicinamibacteria bacterium]
MLKKPRANDNGREMISFFPSKLLAPLMLAAASVSARPVTVDDLMRLRTVVDVRISPGGERVAYVVSEPSLEKNEHVATLYVVAAAGGEPKRLTHGTRIFNRPLPRPELRWSSGGERISFLGYVSDRPQVMVMDVDGGEPRPVTSSPTGVTRYEWSKDGAGLAYLAPEPEPAEEAQKKEEKTYVVSAGRPGRPARLFVQEEEGGKLRVVSPPEHYVLSFDWSPDGKALAYSAAPGSEYIHQWRSKIYAVPAAGGEPVLVVERGGMNNEPRYSPDGRLIAFLSTGGIAGLISSPGLHLVDSRGGEPRSLTGEETWVRELLWEPSSRSLLFIPNEATGRGGEHMFEQPLFRVDLEGKREIVTSGEIVAFSASASRGGRFLAYRSVGPRDMGDVELLDLHQASSRKLTEVNPELHDLDLGTLEPMSWRSFDGMEIWGLLLTPHAYRPGTRVPLVVYVHGGPIGGFTHGLFPQFMHRPGQIDPYPVEVMASEGMAVLMPMPRGGSGYGLAGFRMIVGSWGEGDYRDIMSGVDRLIERGFADPDRLGVMGASYGGFMTNWIVTQTDRFKAASSGASISDIADLYYHSDAGEFTEEYFGLPWEEAALYEAHSPIT